jgi:hypothetical protein
MARSLLVVPTISERFGPGYLMYEKLIAPVRHQADVRLLLVPFGLVPEVFPWTRAELMVVMGDVPERLAFAEAAARIRAWLDLHGSDYDRIALLAIRRHSALRAWSSAMRCNPIGVRVRPILPPRSLGLRATILPQKISTALQVPPVTP